MGRPTFVLAHGACHSPEHFEPLIANLKHHGYQCVAVALPSTHPTEKFQGRHATLADDTAILRDAVVAELDEGNDVVAAGHSYGGIVVNNALHGLDGNARAATGASTAVLALGFMCSMPMPAGTNLPDMAPPDGGIFDPANKEFCVIKDPSGPTHYFYNDLSEHEAKRWCDLLRPMSWEPFRGQTSSAAYLHIPSSYLNTSTDNTLPFAAQEKLVQGAVAMGAKMKAQTVESGHSPFLSRVEETSAWLRRLADGQLAR